MRALSASSTGASLVPVMVMARLDAVCAWPSVAA
jgi:hypothetical protein